MKKPSLEQVKETMIESGMKVFDRPFDMTLGGIRTNDNSADTFNDWLFMMYHDSEGKLCGIIQQGTTDAGLYYRQNPMHIDGTAIIQHGVQHMGAYTYMKTGAHRGQEGFRQTGLMTYWRDPDRDKYLDFDGETEEANYATNGHDMGTRGSIVHNWSAGCWGAVEIVMDKFYELAQMQMRHGMGAGLSYAMLHETNFVSDECDC